MAVASGRWHDERRFEAGYIESPICGRCDQERGMNFHDLFQCDATCGHGLSYSCQASRVMFREAAAYPGAPRWTRSLVADPSTSYPRPLESMQIVWEMPPAEGTHEGSGFGDGSGLNPGIDLARRCGWGLVVYNHDEGIVSRCRGPLPGWLQEPPLAESMAFLIYLTHIGLCTPAFTTDCKFVRDTFLKGPNFFCDGWFVGAAIWWKIWVRLEDIGCPLRDIVVKWIPAHTATNAVENGLLTHLEQTMNMLADESAKEGARKHLYDENVLQQYHTDCAGITFIGKGPGRTLAKIDCDIIQARPCDRTSTSLAGRLTSRAGRKTTQSHGGTWMKSGHTVIRSGGLCFGCIECLATASQLSTFTHTACSGSEKVVKHTLKRFGCIIYCAKCGSYSEKRSSDCDRIAYCKARAGQSRLW